MYNIPYYQSNRLKTDMAQTVRVVDYGRVSTQHEQQLGAFQNQLQSYQDIIGHHPNWKYVGSYSDEGISGTRAKTRPGFMRMINDAKAGKFDLIITREVCRFARNTVDSLEFVRKLRSYGVEVYFVNDNIWSFDGDGEVRLTIFSALAQDESRRTSERVLSGQRESRKNGVLYGNGNILGYDLVKGEKPIDNTYIINEEQAETVRIIYSLYKEGYGEKKIVSRLLEMHRKDANGNVRWCPSKISRILANRTYAGYKCYNKSRTIDFLEHTRVKNLDEDTYMYVKADFPPIIPEEMWDEVQRIKNGKKAKRDSRGVSRGKNPAYDKWTKVLVCECGRTFRRYKWRTNQNTQEDIYGYQCRNQAEHRKKSYYIKNGLDPTGYCDIKSICQWKLEFSLYKILKRIWKEPLKTVKNLMKKLEKSYAEEKQIVTSIELPSYEKEKEQIEKRLESLLEALLDKVISREQFQEKEQKLRNRLEEVNQKIAELKMKEAEKPVSLNDRKSSLEKIQKTLERYIDIEKEEVDFNIVTKFVSRVVPHEDDRFCWYLNLGDVTGEKSKKEFDEEDYILYDNFTISFEEAKEYKKSFGKYIRKNQWEDMRIEVYIRV